jgi:polar amino acid transport system substrate-binding protein
MSFHRSPRPMPPWLLLALAFAAFALPRPAAAADFISMSAQTWPPYYLDNAARPGYAREVLQICVPQAGYELRTSPLGIDRMYDGLRLGIVDAHVLSFDPKRASYLLYGKVPLFSDGYRPVVRAGSGVQIHSLADFDKLRVGHLRGLRYSDAYHDYIEKRLAAGTVTQVDSNDELLELLLSGKIDVYVNLAGTSRWLARQMGAAGKIAVLPFDIKRSDYLLAVSQKSTHVHDKQGFLDAFDACVLKLQKDGRLKQLREKYDLE